MAGTCLSSHSRGVEGEGEDQAKGKEEKQGTAGEEEDDRGQGDVQNSSLFVFFFWLLDRFFVTLQGHEAPFIF